jgi:hypothetical protein
MAHNHLLYLLHVRLAAAYISGQQALQAMPLLLQQHSQ